MADESPNPYAPPATEPMSPDLQRGLWKCENGELWVRSGVLIPEVDLLTGEVRPEKTSERRISFMKWNLRTFVLMIFSIGTLMGRKLLESRWGIQIPYALFLVLLWLLVMMAGRWIKPPVWTVRYHQSLASARKRLLPIIIWVVCIIASCGLVVGAVAVLGIRHFDPVTIVWSAVGAPLLVMFVGGMFVLRGKRALRPGERAGDWLLLKGVHPDAIAHLMTLPTFVPPPSHPDSRIYVVHLAKCPLGEWFKILGKKPRPWFNVLLAKLLNRRALDTRAVIQLKPVLQGPEAVSPEFVAQIQALEPALLAEGWQKVAWNMIPIPDRFNSRSESVCFFHRDHRDLLHFSLTRGDAYPGTLKTAVRSWLPDGTLLTTTDELYFTVTVLPGTELESLPGTPSADLIHKHMQKSTARGAGALADANEGLERLIRAHLENHARLQAKGIYGPLEEISA
ncbi:MAG: hypothetical protein QM755_17765 [Luteolibacter sp.]